MTTAVQRRVPYSLNQFINFADLNKFGVFAVEGSDALGLDIVGPDAAWTAIAAIEESATSVRVNFGRIWLDGKFYGDPDKDTEIVSLVTALPTGTKKIVTIVGTGAEVETKYEPRSFKNTETGNVEPQTIPTEILRKVTFSYVSGTEAATPIAPTLDPNFIPIANVTLGVSGIEKIDLLTEYRLPTLQGMNARMISIEKFRLAIGTRVETLASDLATMRADVGQLNAPSVRQTQRRLAELEDKLGIDEGGLLYGFDRMLTEAESDTVHGDYNARIEEGLRFPFTASSEHTPALLNPGDPRLSTVSGWSLPPFAEVARVDTWGQGVTVNVANYQYSNTDFTIYPGAQRRRRYGPSMVVAGNSDFWQSSQYSVNYLTQTFNTGAENYLISDEWTEDGVTYYRLQQYWDDKIKYWNGYQAITPTTQGGYLVGQTFLNAQSGWLTSVGLRFGKVDDAYGVKVYLCRAPNGEPDPNQIVAEGSLAAGQAIASQGDPDLGAENKVTLTPAFLNAGDRYGLILVTGGDYAVACRSDNALTNGAFFVGDGAAWAVDLGKDMAMRLYFAEFDVAFTAVQLETVTLSGGITDIDVISTEHVPEGCELYWMVRFGGAWHRLERFTGTHPLAAAPATVELQLVMMGTRDIMPAIKLPNSLLRLNKGGNSFTHLSETRDAGSAASAVRVELEIAAWDAGKHSLVATIEAGGNSDAPSSTTDYPLPNGNLRRVMEFTLTAASQIYQVKLVGSTTDIAASFVVASRYDLARA
jgi:hypothetical protein